jgi:DNA polymerase delta subunit 3
MKDLAVGDPLEAGPTYGMIRNPYVKRRLRKGRAIKSAAPPIAPKATQQKPGAAKPNMFEKIKQEGSETPNENQTPSSSAKKPATILSLKKTSSGDIMQSFAKASAKAASQPRSAKPKPSEQNSVDALSDDGEDDSEAIPATKEAGIGRKSRKEREAELRRMMEEDDDDDDDEPESKPASPAEEPMEVEPEPAPEPEPEPTETLSSSADGRKRGKRKVMKKKQKMDDQGYLGKLIHKGILVG